MTTIYTVGHGTLPAETFAAVLDSARIHRVVDVRSFPGSRHNPQFGREAMEQWLPGAGIAYIWMRDLGGRRRPVDDSPHRALRHGSFRAYADYMGKPDFLAGIGQLMELAVGESTAVMCSESVWWRCHRRLLADHLMLIRGVEVINLMHDGRHTPHVPTQGVRVIDDALIYDVGVTPPLPTD